MTAQRPFSPACERNREPILGVLREYFADRAQVLEIGSGTGQHAVHFAAALPHLVWQTSDLAVNHAGIRAWISDSGLGSVDIDWIAALLPEKAPGKARAAGHGRSMAKVRNAAWRFFERNPKGRGHFCAPRRRSSLVYFKYTTLLSPCAAQKWPPSQRSSQCQQTLGNVRTPLLLDANLEHWRSGPYDALFSANTLHIMSWPAVKQLFAHLSSVLAADAVVAVYGPFNYGGAFTSVSNETFDAWLKAQNPAMGIRDFEAVDALAQSAGLRLVEDRAMPANNRCLVWRRENTPAGQLFTL